MADRPSPPETGPPGAPRWVKVFAIVAVAVVVLILAVALLSGGEHGPGRHLPGGDTSRNHTPPVQHTS